MAFKRTINGKEYLYESARVDGKVKSIYLGPAKKDKKKILRPFIVSFLILSLLILSGPAQAVTVTSSADKSTYKALDPVNFTVGVDIDAGERIPVKNLTLTISSGQVNKTCVFTPGGTAVSGCGNLTIYPIYTVGYASSTNLYGYGYGYDISSTSYGNNNESFANGYGYGYVSGYSDSGLYAGGELRYNITWNLTAETLATTGNYTAFLSAHAQDGTGDFIYSNINNKTSFSIDSVAPTVSLTYPLNLTYNTTLVNVTFTAVDDISTSSTCLYTLDGANTTIGSATNNTATSVNTSDLANGQHAINVTCSDAAGNYGTSSTQYFSLSYAVGAGVTITVSTSTPATNKTKNTPAQVNVVKVNKTLPIVPPGLAKKLEFENASSTNIKSLSITTKNTQTNVTISVQTLAEEPTETSGFAIAGLSEIYRYLEFTSSVSNDDIEEAVVEFQLPKAWLEENGYKTNQIRLTRFHNGAWSTLPTTLVSSDGENYYFEAKTPGFSYFAIFAKLETTISTLRDLFDLIDSYFSGSSALTLRELFDSIETYFGG
ncbi:hypothetical protein COT72_03910 [archaeon CG10_big_fil_rev_8_21_14_0_10_43_11]|nr:MAG: hypothetical protein COT72_03910 [archaeon CG10_big_fil_rev_8_21_14_0_10_43_11]